MLILIQVCVYQCDLAVALLLLNIDRISLRFSKIHFDHMFQEFSMVLVLTRDLPLVAVLKINDQSQKSELADAASDDVKPMKIGEQLDR